VLSLPSGRARVGQGFHTSLRDRQPLKTVSPHHRLSCLQPRLVPGKLSATARAPDARADPLRVAPPPWGIVVSGGVHRADVLESAPTQNVARCSFLTAKSPCGSPWADADPRSPSRQASGVFVMPGKRGKRGKGGKGGRTVDARGERACISCGEAVLTENGYPLPGQFEVASSLPRDNSGRTTLARPGPPPPLQLTDLYHTHSTLAWGGRGVGWGLRYRLVGARPSSVDTSSDPHVDLAWVRARKVATRSQHGLHDCIIAQPPLPPPPDPPLRCSCHHPCPIAASGYVGWNSKMIVPWETTHLHTFTQRSHL
jgi:hypothetical protein